MHVCGFSHFKTKANITSQLLLSPTMTKGGGLGVTGKLVVSALVSSFIRVLLVRRYKLLFICISTSDSLDKSFQLLSVFTKQSLPTTRETECQCDNMQKVTREVGCQTDRFVGKRTVATQLSKRTLSNRKSTGMLRGQVLSLSLRMSVMLTDRF